MSFPNAINNPPQANWAPVAVENWEALAAQAMYAQDYATTSGLDLGYFGGHIASNVVAHRTTGAVTDATNTTNWDATSTYGRLFKATTAGGVITAIEDWREQSGGWFDRAAAVAAGDVVGPASATDSHFAQFDTTTGKLLKGGLAPSTDGTMASNSATKVPVEAAIVTYVAAQVTALIASAPGALDTLDELAAALGDDANFASTVTTALAGKAPLKNTVTALATSGSVAIDCALGDYFTLALAGNVSTFTFSNLPGAGKGASIMVQITQDSTPRTVGWPASFKWEGGVAGTVSTGSGDVDVLALTTFDNGTTWRATLANDFA
jgi:hypothetical protein